MATPTTATPYLTVRDAARALDFYTRAFGARETLRLTAPGGTRIGHAEIDVGGARIMLADEFPEMGARGPETIGGTPVTIALKVPDVDEFVRRAVVEGATLARPVSDQFYGERAGMLTDPFGHRWHVSTHVEDVPADEMQRRYEAMVKQQQ